MVKTKTKFVFKSDIDDTLNLRAGEKIPDDALNKLGNLIEKGIHFSADSGKPAYYTEEKQIKQLIDLLGSEFSSKLSVAGNNGAETILNPFSNNKETIKYNLNENNANYSIKQLNNIGNIMSSLYPFTTKEQVNGMANDNERLVYTLFPITEKTLDLLTLVQDSKLENKFESLYQNLDNVEFTNTVETIIGNNIDYKQFISNEYIPSANKLCDYANLLIEELYGSESEIVCVGHSDAIDILIAPKNGNPINKGQSLETLCCDIHKQNKIHISDAVKIVKSYVGDSFDEEQYIRTHSEYLIPAITAGDGGNDKELLANSLFSITVESEKTKSKGLYEIATTIVDKNPLSVINEAEKMYSFIIENNLEYI